MFRSARLLTIILTSLLAGVVANASQIDDRARPLTPKAARAMRLRQERILTFERNIYELRGRPVALMHGFALLDPSCSSLPCTDLVPLDVDAAFEGSRGAARLGDLAPELGTPGKMIKLRVRLEFVRAPKQTSDGQPEIYRVGQAVVLGLEP